MAARSSGSCADGASSSPASSAEDQAVSSSMVSHPPARSCSSRVAIRAFVPISSLAPLSPRICATCARLSSGLTGTWTIPARAAASGSRQVSSPLAAQLATRSPFASFASSQPASSATRPARSAWLSVRSFSTSAGASRAPRSAKWSSGLGRSSRSGISDIARPLSLLRWPSASSPSALPCTRLHAQLRACPPRSLGNPPDI